MVKKPSAKTSPKSPPALTTLVVDTNVLISDPMAVFRYPNSRIVIPIFVIEELDGLKKALGETGAKARKALKTLKQIHAGEQPAFLLNGAQVEIFTPKSLKLPDVFVEKIYDNKIIQCAVVLKATLITQDVNMQIRARGLGLNVLEHEIEVVERKDIKTLNVQGSVIDGMFNEGLTLVKTDANLHVNEPIRLESTTDPQHVGLGRVRCVAEGLAEISLIKEHKKVWGLSPRNVEQRFLLDLLLDPDLDLITVEGRSGCGKSLCSVAAALHMVQDLKTHDKVIVCRSIVSMGDNELGWLPGSQSEKLNPWFKPIFDSIEVLVGNKQTKHRPNSDLPAHQFLIDLGVLEIQSLEHIRGASINNAVIILEEGQNTSIHEMKTILTRAGDNTKIIITGDPDQIDTPKLSRDNNGLVYVANKFRGEAIAAHITLKQCERSRLADLASRIM